VDVEASSRLASVLSVIEHEMDALSDLRDDRLVPVLQSMTMLQAEIVAVLALLRQPNSNGQL
jgi:hypothetical protein